VPGKLPRSAVAPGWDGTFAAVLLKCHAVCAKPPHSGCLLAEAHEEWKETRNVSSMAEKRVYVRWSVTPLERDWQIRWPGLAEWMLPMQPLRSICQAAPQAMA
jgi:hypothetical protein